MQILQMICLQNVTPLTKLKTQTYAAWYIWIDQCCDSFDRALGGDEVKWVTLFFQPRREISAFHVYEVDTLNLQ